MRFAPQLSIFTPPILAPPRHLFHLCPSDLHPLQPTPPLRPRSSLPACPLSSVFILCPRPILALLPSLPLEPSSPSHSRTCSVLVPPGLHPFHPRSSSILPLLGTSPILASRTFPPYPHPFGLHPLQCSPFRSLTADFAVSFSCRGFRANPSFRFPIRARTPPWALRHTPNLPATIYRTVNVLICAKIRFFRESVGRMQNNSVSW